LSGHSDNVSETRPAIYLKLEVKIVSGSGVEFNAI